MKDKNHNPSLIKSIKDNLAKEDQAVASYLDFSKTNEAIIVDMIAAEHLNFDDNNRDKKTS